MRTYPASRVRSERGATLVHVAIALVSLMGLAAFTVDRGIVWVSRGQAQNAADAGALAGAVSRAYEDPDTTRGLAAPSALLTAQGNVVWGVPATANVSWACPTGVSGLCARVDVYRNGEFGSTGLPVVFARVLGISTQGVRATATAVVQHGNATNCMRPWSVPDKWDELVAPTEEFNHWESMGGGAVELDPHDIYSNPGAGWDLDSHLGTQFILKTGTNPNSASVEIKPGWSLPVRLPDGEGGYISGADDYREAIKHCIGTPVAFDDYLPLENGEMVGPTDQGVERHIDSLVQQDPLAVFVPEAGDVPAHIEGGCVPGCGPISPRIVPISVFDVEIFNKSLADGDWSYCPDSNKCIQVKQILGFFVQGMSGTDVIGYLMTAPGFFVEGAPGPPGGAEWLINIQLVR